MLEVTNRTDQGAWLPWALLPPTAVWLGMTFLRESVSFWRNSGGYPVQLRSLVQHSYYPFTAVLLVTCVTGATVVFRRTQAIARRTMLCWLIVAMAIGFGLAYAGANNLANLIDGRPLHYHAE